LTECAVPEGIVLHFAAVPPKERSWIDAVPVTSTSRTLNDCALAGFSPDMLRQAAKQALSRGLVTRAELGEVEKALKPFGGIKDDNTELHISADIQASAGAASAHRVEKRRRLCATPTTIGV
jgi:hypothetical protein